MTLQDILGVKGSAVHAIAMEATLADVVGSLVEHNVGSLLIFMEGGQKLAGIITERDILHACAAGKAALAKVKVADVMSTDLVTGSPGDSVEAAMGLMTSKRIRHLPVLEEGKLVGLVSIGDVVKSQHDRLAMENRFMKDYIRG